ncbi:39S ribosomal protein L55, mitochondrial [Sorex araneus]|uniref:39S ribosomal protein L55, mitochondrial n=1 Tax=Sorex araneus TaxID=42254 RepID=UPI0024335475|nr:39S ribosomal protein L55, mitochondrial [Sorex araneus]
MRLGSTSPPRRSRLGAKGNASSKRDCSGWRKYVIAAGPTSSALYAMVVSVPPRRSRTPTAPALGDHVTGAARCGATCWPLGRGARHAAGPRLLQVARRARDGVCGMAAPGGLLGLVLRAAGAGRSLHTSSWRADSSRASLTRVHRQAYARLYPVLLVRQDGSTIHIRYREPRRMLVMPLDLDSLTPEERRARFRKREAQLREKKVEEPQLTDDFDQERYKQFWTKK